MLKLNNAHTNSIYKVPVAHRQREFFLPVALCATHIPAFRRGRLAHRAFSFLWGADAFASVFACGFSPGVRACWGINASGRLGGAVA